MKEPKESGETPSLPAPPLIGPDGEKRLRDPRTLSAEEQMERYEEDLKENDWGHQPC